MLLVLLVGLDARIGQASTACADDLQWKPFVSQEGSFSVEMPGSPICTEKDEPTPVGPIRENLFSVECGGIVLDAEYSILPNIAALFASRNRVYREVIQEFLKRMNAREVAVGAFTLDAYHGRILTYETSERFGKLWMLLVSRRIYVLHASVSRAAVDRSPIDYFFSTFKPIYRMPKELHPVALGVGQADADTL
jgi:hypothetical protein